MIGSHADGVVESRWWEVAFKMAETARREFGSRRRLGEFSFVPGGTFEFFYSLPSDESLGYFLSSLRDWND